MSNSNDFVEANQKFAVNIVMGLLAWIFGVSVFLPTTSVYAPDWARIVALLLIVDITYYFIKARAYSAPLFDYVSNRITSSYLGWRNISKDDRPRVWRSVKKVLGVCLSIVVYLMYKPLLMAVSIILPGIAFILVLLQILKYVLFPRNPIIF